jgi:hypothetical protein
LSATLTQRAEDPADFGKDKAGVAARWIAELKLAEKGFDAFWNRGDKIVARYMDERRSENRTATRFNVLWSNIQTLKPAIYATPPKPVVQRRYLDQDPVARAASTILQRAIQTMIEATGWHEVTDQCVMDYLLVGRGTPWVRYEPHFEDIQAPAVQGMEAGEDGLQGAADMPDAPPVVTEQADMTGLAPDADNEDEGEGPEDDGLQVTNNAEGQEITYEEVCWDYVFWKDFYHSPARTWQEVRWVAREVLMTREEGVERFGAMFRDVPMNWKPKDMEDSDPAFQLFTRARVFEIWDKPSRKVIWVCPDYSSAPLDEKDDFLKLNDFFPCPRPLYASLSNSSLIPSPDFKQYQDQADELDDLTTRMAEIARDVKVAGVYDAANDEIQRLFQEGHENKLIGIPQWSAFAQSGGFKGAVDWLPLESMVVALRELAETRERTKQDLYEITGIADIVRGQGAATATATAERLKGQFAQLRLRDRVGNVARFCRDMVRITGELIAKHFQPQTLLLLSDYQQTTGATPELAMQAIELLKNDQTRGFRIEIEVDSTVVADQEQEQQSRVAFLQMAGQFLREAVPLSQQLPALAPLAGQMLLFGIRGFPVGREMETVFETALEQLAQASQAPQPEAPPDPAIVKAQMDQQTAQAEMQMQAQLEQAKLQSEAQAREQTAALEAAKLQLEQARLDLEDRKLRLEEQRTQLEDSRAVEDRALKAQDIGLKAREASVNQEASEITAVQDAMAAIQQALDNVTQRVEDAHKVASAPRRVTIERGPDGRAIGARQELEGL